MNETLERTRRAMEAMAEEVHPRITMSDLVRRRTRRRQTRNVATVLTLALAIAATAIVSIDFLPPTVPEPEPATTPTFDGLPVGWTRLPAPPQARSGASFVWAGDRLLAFGGSEPGASTPSVSVFSLGPVGHSWSRIPDAPLAGEGAVAVWTGREAIFVGVGNGWQVESYDPASMSWSIIAPPPIPQRRAPMVVWTGQELIVWGGSIPAGPPLASGAAYDPAIDTWRTIAPSPVALTQGSTVWLWPRMIVFGGDGHSDTAVGAMYDPVRDVWRSLPPSSLSPLADSAVAVGRSLLAWDYLGQSQVGDFPVGNTEPTWEPVARLPLHTVECYPDSTVVENDASREAFAWLCGHGALWDRSRAGWTPISGGPPSDFRTGAVFRTGEVVGAGRMALLTPDGDGPWFVWAYRPPSNASTAAELATPAFEPAVGWNTITTSTDPGQLESGSAPMAWASNRAFSERDLAGHVTGGALSSAIQPDQSLRGLDPDGVFITASLYGDVPRVKSELPLDLPLATVLTHWEGQPASNVPEYQLIGGFEGRRLDVRVYFGTLHPSPATLAAAQEELGRLRLPPRA